VAEALEKEPRDHAAGRDAEKAAGNLNRQIGRRSGLQQQTP